MNKFCQTESEEMIFCYECEFPAEDFYDFGEHMLEYHFDGTCKVCAETFTTKENFQIIQVVPKRIRLGFCLISRQPSIGFLNLFFS